MTFKFNPNAAIFIPAKALHPSCSSAAPVASSLVAEQAKPLAASPNMTVINEIRGEPTTFANLKQQEQQMTTCTMHSS